MAAWPERPPSPPGAGAASPVPSSPRSQQRPEVTLERGTSATGVKGEGWLKLFRSSLAVAVPIAWPRPLRARAWPRLDAPPSPKLSLASVPPGLARLEGGEGARARLGDARRRTRPPSKFFRHFWMWFSQHAPRGGGGGKAGNIVNITA